MSDTTDKLHVAMEGAPMRFRSVFRHAISLAMEADCRAETVSMELQHHITPVYPVLVELLAETLP
ncbi:hypothetical protein AN915_04215 [Mycobacteroides immunogenum]|uniref:Uncharacterized protein n=1 Tax=Mycobacteroides immunogenum TaxID=83262 RepID=A0A7V8LRB0_9MYCO|nr:hypothetical protein AN908_06610 [Mycobacteroides immunogenum]KPG14333.1 hypothetical protein AN908_07130 [Mycobacteroides immunogenum]KPG38989.1 hypothetical protein AN914_09695 [Mycobacteroides immunogenum]KPG39065.1 hypothetical protein AN914_10215 [Mycobacteroides immunogenum]KPG47278.1 hypothetical protein AN915_03710 [Mycobacteroides immunogenum]